jgi:protein-disulfide isomerase
MNKFTVAIIVVILAAFGGLVGYSVYNKNNNKPKELDLSDVNSGIVIEAEERNGYIADHVRGKADSKIVVVEYADYQCPGCASMTPHVDKLYEEYKDDVAFVFRNFPLKSHPNARAASAAAEAAGKQGYFWEMYDSVYSNRNSWTELTGDARTNTFAELFAGVAKDGDVEQFRKDLTDENVLKKIDFDYELGLNVDHVTATPSIYINGVALDVTSVGTFDEVEDLVRKELDAKIADQKGEKSSEAKE